MMFDEWEQRDDGNRYLSGEYGCSYHLDAILDGWRLSQYEDPEDGPTFVYESEDLSELSAIFEVIHDQAREKQAVIARGPREIVTELEPGLRIISTTDGPTFTCKLKKDGELVGEYFGSINDAQPTFVLGQLTITGSQQLWGGNTRRGLGKALVNAGEELMGLPAVPHRLALTVGVLSMYATRFWDKRASTGVVPGMPMTAEAASRLERLMSYQTGVLKRTTDYWQTAVFSAAKLGLGVTVLDEREEDGDVRPCHGWPISAEGLAVSATGILSPIRLREYYDRYLGKTYTDRSFCPEETQLLAASIEPASGEYALRQIDQLVSLGERIMMIEASSSPAPAAKALLQRHGW